MESLREKRPSSSELQMPTSKRFCPPESSDKRLNINKREQALAELLDYSDLVPVDDVIEDFHPPQQIESPRASVPLFKAPAPKKLKPSSLPIDLPFSAYRIPRDMTAFSEFIARWRQVSRYALSLVWISRPNPRKRLPQSSPVQFTDDGEENGHLSRSLSNPVTSNMAAEDLVFFVENQKPIALVITWDKSRCYLINLTSSKRNSDDFVLHKERMKMLKEVLEMPNTEKIAFDCKPQLKLFLELNIVITHGLRDPRIAAWILQPDTHKDPMLRDLFSDYSDSIMGSKASLRIGYTPGLGETEKAIRSSILCAHQALLVMEPMEHSLRLNSMHELFTDMEMKLVPILAKMEYYGVGFSIETLLQAREMLELKIRSLEKRAKKCSKEDFDLNSPMEVSHILFDHLKLPLPSLEVGGLKDGFAAGVLQSVSLEGARPTKSPATAPMRTKRVEKSTRAEVLQAMARLPNPHPLPNIILEHRTLSHTINNYMDPLPNFSFPSTKLGMRRIYSTCHQTCVPTGRLAFDNPNLQSIRHAFEFVPLQNSSSHSSRTSSTSQSPPSSVSIPSPIAAPIEINIRDSFIAAPNMTLVSFDYCQLELRIMAHYAEDQSLLQQLRDPKVDMFAVIAGQWLVKPPSEITGEERAQAKHICYGILYGMGTEVLSRTLKVTRAEAKSFRTAFQQRFSGLTRFLNTAVALTKKNGYSETLGGRRRHFPHIY